MSLKIKEELCKTFCGALSVHEVPAGLAIGAGFDGMSGDPIGFYIVGPNESGKYAIEDNGLYIPTIEALGADLENKTRLEAFHSLLDEYSVYFDEDSGELKTDSLSEQDIPVAALRFMAFLLRVQDLVLMSVERAASTFKEDAIRALREIAPQSVTIEERFIVHDKLKEIPADLGITSPNRPPVAVFFGVTESKIYEALLLQAYAENEDIPCSVVAMLETERSLSQKLRQRAANHLDAFPIFRGDERTACSRVLKEAGIQVLH